MSVSILFVQDKMLQDIENQCISVIPWLLVGYKDIFKPIFIDFKRGGNQRLGIARRNLSWDKRGRISVFPSLLKAEIDGKGTQYQQRSNQARRNRERKGEKQGMQ